jgi:hypothetical protein
VERLRPLPVLCLIGVVALLLSTLIPPAADHGDGRSNAGLSPAVTTSTTYHVALSAINNATASTNTISSSAVWTAQAHGYAILPFLALGSGTWYSWNGTYNFLDGVQVEFEPACYTQTPSGSCQAYSIGTLWANLSVGPQTYSTAITYNAEQVTVSPTYVYAAFQLRITGPTTIVSGLTFTVSPGPTTGGYTYLVTRPTGLRTVPISGKGINFPYATSYGSAGASPLDWGWHWPGSGQVSSTFSVPQEATSVSIAWSSPYDVNATYNSVTQHTTTSGTFSLASPTTIEFQGGNSDPASVFSFTVTYTISGTLIAQFLLTYNYTQPWGAGHQTTSSTFGATTVSVWNATWSEYTYTIPTPFSNVTKVTAEAGNTSWVMLSAWPASYTYYTGNATGLWTSPVPSYVQIVFLAPIQYGSATLSIVYVPSSSIFSLFGAALPYAAVLTYVNGIYAPYDTQPANLGQSYTITTYDIFNHLLATTVVKVTTPAQVASITLNIWPMSIVNLNSSYVVSLNINNYGITQVAPDLMPLQSYVFYLPQGSYNFTIQYLQFEGGAVGAPITFVQDLTGVSYDVVNGLTFFSVIANEQSIGNNLTKVITGVNITLLSTAANLENLINSISSGLFAFHLVTGTGTRTADTFSIPITVTTSTGAAANISVTKQMSQTVVLTYLNQTGTFDIAAFGSGATAGQFTLSFTLTGGEVTALEAGTAAMLVTATETFGNSANIGTGVIAGAVISEAIPVGTPVNPLSQDVYLGLGNLTRNATSGFSTVNAQWVNDFNQTYTGEFTVVGPFLGGGSITVSVNGTELTAAEFAVTANALVIYAGVLNIPRGTTVTISVSYERVSSFNVWTTPLVRYGTFVITTPYLLLIIAAVVVVGAGFEDYRKRSDTLDAITSVALAFLVFGAMFLGI